DVRLEVAEAVIGMRVDRVDRHAVARLRAEPETDRRLSLPRADLHDDAVAPATPCKLVERLTLLVGEPSRDVGDERLHARRKRISTRHGGAASLRSRSVPAVLGRATGTSPTARPGH